MQEACGPIPCMLCGPARRVVDAGEGCLVQSSFQRGRGKGRKDEIQIQNHEPLTTNQEAERGGQGPTCGDMITCVV